MLRLLSKIDTMIASSGLRFWAWTGLFIYFIAHGLFYQNDIMLWPSPDIWLTSIDSDVYTRLAKVRDLLQGGNFYNYIMTATNAPYSGISTPWTRPLDFILVFLYQFTPSDFSIEKRLLLVANWYPLLMIGCIIYFMQKAVDTGFKSTQKFVILMLCLISTYIFNPYNYFMVGNADHHSLQAALWCLSLWLILNKPSPRAAIWLGTIFGLWFWVSPESLPFILTSYAALGLKAILQPDKSYSPLLTSIIVLIVTFLALFVEYPPHLLLSVVYDANSIVYVTLFAFCALGFATLHFMISRERNLIARLTIASATAVILISIYLCLFSRILMGPMADTEPYITNYFLSKISEATPFYKLDADILVGTLYLAIPAFLLSVRYIKKSPLFFVFLLMTLTMFAFQNRWGFYLQICSIIIIAKLLPTYIRALRQKYKCTQLLHPYICVVVLCALTHIIFLCLLPLQPSTSIRITPCQIEAFQVRQSGSLVNALGNHTLTVESNALGASGISFFTPYRYIAGNYHREGKGLKVKYTILDSTNLDSVRPLLKQRGVNALLLCPTPYPSWVNDYFTGSAPERDWVKINQNLKFSNNSDITPHPLLLNIEP